MLFPVKWAFVWLAKRTGSLESGAPTPLMMTVTLLLIMVAAFFTDVIGQETVQFGLTQSQINFGYGI